jgi:hypothetical protein
MKRCSWFLSILCLLLAAPVMAQTKLNGVLGNIKKGQDIKKEVKTSLGDMKPDTDTTKKNVSTAPQDTVKKDKFAIGDEGSDDKKQDGKKVKQTKNFVKDSKNNNTGTTPNGNGNLVDPNSTKKNIAIGEEGSDDGNTKKDNSPRNNNVNNGTTTTPKK